MISALSIEQSVFEVGDCSFLLKFVHFEIPELLDYQVANLFPSLIF